MNVIGKSLIGLAVAMAPGVLNAQVFFDSDIISCLRAVTATPVSSLPEGHKPGLTVCSAMAFPSGKAECLGEVRGKNYQPEAASVCRVLTFDSSKMECLRLIANKTFDPAELDVCRPQQANPPKGRTGTFSAWVTNYSSYVHAYSYIESYASQKCTGWAFYAMEDKNWKQTQCWLNGDGLVDCYVGFYCTSDR